VIWRLVRTEPMDGAENMAVDEVLMRGSRGGMPTLRFYTWSPPAVSVGYFQQLTDEVRLDRCREAGVDVVRRLTGGRAVLHEHEVTYSVTAPVSLFPGDVVETFRYLSAGLLEGLRLLGLEAEVTRAGGGRGPATSPACFDAAAGYEVVARGKKIIGSAQTRREGALLQHGSILIRFDARRLTSLLNFTGPPLGSWEERRVVEYLMERAAGLSDVLGRELEPAEVTEAFIAGFARALGWELKEIPLTPEEVRQARLLAQRYRSREWNEERRPVVLEG